MGGYSSINVKYYQYSPQKTQVFYPIVWCWPSDYHYCQVLLPIILVCQRRPEGWPAVKSSGRRAFVGVKIMSPSRDKTVELHIKRNEHNVSTS